MTQGETSAVLLIVPDFAYAPSTGCGQRSALLFEALASRFDVEVLVINEYSRPGQRGNLYGARRYFEIHAPPVSMRGGWGMIRRRSPQAADRVAASLTPQADHYSPVRDCIGEVEDISTDYARSDLVICPVFEGGGNKIKVLEAFSHGRAVVAARHSARGYDRELAEEAIVVADNDEEMANRCVELLQNPGRARVLAERGRRIVSERYDRRTFTQIVLSDCARVLEAQTARKDGLAA